MPIETSDLVLYKSERLTDTADGGGKYSGQIVVDGQSNNLFNDISELDRLGDVAMRKIFAGVRSQDTDVLMGTTAFISQLPQDPNVSALLFSTNSHTDVRSAAQNRVENYTAKGAQAVGSLLDAAYEGMKSIQVAMSAKEKENQVSDTIALVVNEGKSNEFVQFLRITAVSTRLATVRISNSDKEYKIVTYTFSDALERDFIGLSAVEWYNNSKSATIIRDTLVADSGRYYSSKPLSQNANFGDSSVMVPSVFTQLVPSAQSEVPIIDVNAAGESIALVAANDDPISLSLSTNVADGNLLYIGSSVMPNSLSIEMFGQTVTEKGGFLRTTTDAQVGTINYENGLITWLGTLAGSGSTTVNISFKPAALQPQPTQTHAVLVTQQNQSVNWTGVLTPPPTPGALSISYMAQGNYYTLSDDGSGRLTASDTSFGSGSINYETGSWLLTTGALPDVNTPILLTWATPITVFNRADLEVAPAGFDFQLFHNGIASLTATWTLNGVAKSATTNSAGMFTGDATGYVRFNNGKGRLIPNQLPQKGTVFTFSYNYGTGKTQEKIVMPVDGVLEFTIGTGTAIQPSSVGLEIPIGAYLVEIHDVPIDAMIGNLVNKKGEIMGQIEYATGDVSIEPYANVVRNKFNYAPIIYALRNTVNVSA